MVAGLRTVARGAWGMARAATTPLLPDDAIALVNPLLSGADLYGRITSITPATESVTAPAAHLRIRPGRGWRGHRPGQYIRIGVDVDGVRTWRAYSLTSGPGERELEITVKTIDGGRVSRHLVLDARPGDVVLLDQATGEFVLDPIATTNPLFITAGSGLTPVIGMLRHHLAAFTDPVLVHSAPTGRDVLFAGELRRWADEGRLRLVERHTDVDGWFTPEQLEATVGDWRERPAWACGPTALLDAFEEHYAAAGLAHLLHTERFRATLVEPGDGGLVRFEGSDVEVDVDGATTLLDAGEEAGVVMPSGCRMGICYNCSSPLLAGTVRDLRNGQLTSNDPVQNPMGTPIQTCISASAGACTIAR